MSSRPPSKKEQYALDLIESGRARSFRELRSFYVSESTISSLVRLRLIRKISPVDYEVVECSPTL